MKTINQSDVTLKNVKYFAAGSQETYCYTATLCVNDTPLADVENSGHGGPTNVHLLSTIQAKTLIMVFGIDPRATTKFVNYKCEGTPTHKVSTNDGGVCWYCKNAGTVLVDLESAADHAMTEYLIKKDLAALRKKLVAKAKKSGHNCVILGDTSSMSCRVAVQSPESVLELLKKNNRELPAGAEIIFC